MACDDGWLGVGVSVCDTVLAIQNSRDTDVFGSYSLVHHLYDYISLKSTTTTTKILTTPQFSTIHHHARVRRARDSTVQDLTACPQVPVCTRVRRLAHQNSQQRRDPIRRRHPHVAHAHLVASSGNRACAGWHPIDRAPSTTLTASAAGARTRQQQWHAGPWILPGQRACRRQAARRGRMQGCRRRSHDGTRRATGVTLCITGMNTFELSMPGMQTAIMFNAPAGQYSCTEASPAPTASSGSFRRTCCVVVCVKTNVAYPEQSHPCVSMLCVVPMLHARVHRFTTLKWVCACGAFQTPAHRCTHWMVRHGKRVLQRPHCHLWQTYTAQCSSMWLLDGTSRSLTLRITWKTFKSTLLLFCCANDARCCYLVMCL